MKTNIYAIIEVGNTIFTTSPIILSTIQSLKYSAKPSYSLFLNYKMCNWLVRWTKVSS